MERRRFLKGLGIVVGGTSLGGVIGPYSRPRMGRLPRPMPAAAGAAVHALFRDLPEGSRIGEGWTLSQIHGVTLGAVPVVLSATGGRRCQIDVLRRDEDPTAPRAVASTRFLELFVANGGDGATRTDEDHGNAATALAEALARREGATPPVAGLLTLRQRHARHPDGFYAALA